MAENEDNSLEDFKRATAIAIKAIGQTPELEVAFTDSTSDASGNRVKVPHPGNSLSETNIAFVRGAADSAALRLRYHDDELYIRTEPQNPPARAVFAALEQARCDALGAKRMKGVANNLSAFIDEKMRGKGFTESVAHAETSMADALQIIAYELFTGNDITLSNSNAIKSWRSYMKDRGGDYFEKLSTLVSDQQAFAEEAHHLIKQLGLDPSKNETEEKNDEEKPPPPEEQPEPLPEKRDEAKSEGDEEAETEGEADEDRGNAEITGQQDMNEKADGRTAAPSPQDYEFIDGPRTTYRAFTTEFDEVVSAETLCPPEEMERLRILLDQRVQQVQGVIVRLANRLQRRLLAQQTRAWDFDLEEGILDAARLARIVVDPAQPLSFKMEKETDFRDTVVTLLLDNSGSMRFKPITLAAISADILARTLERCGVKVEILGFTTRTWKGGQSREAWVKAGKPTFPGRLNDLRHIIYKAADAPWRRAKNNLGLMLREGLLKENIDGEALLWAYKRLAVRKEQRRILMVISDGAPVDDSTLSTNHGNYLEQHLRSVIDWIEKSSKIQLVAIGIGHDVTKYYKRAVTITDVEQLGGTLMEQLADLFDEKNTAARKKLR